MQPGQARVWRLRRLRACVSKIEWYCFHSDADILGGFLVHVSIPLRTSLRLQRDTASSLPAIMLCSSEGIFRKGELLLRVNASSTKHGNRRFLPLLFEALCFSFHVFESRLAVISQSVSQFCSHRVHLVCRLGFTMGNRVILTFRSDSDRTCNTLKTYRMKQGCRHLGILC